MIDFMKSLVSSYADSILLDYEIFDLRYQLDTDGKDEFLEWVTDTIDIMQAYDQNDLENYPELPQLVMDYLIDAIHEWENKEED